MTLVLSGARSDRRGKAEGPVAGKHIAFVSTCDVNLYPSLLYLANEFQKRGHACTFLARIEPRVSQPSASMRPISWQPIQQSRGRLAKLPVVRGDYHGILRGLMRLKPDAIVAQHGSIVSALAYKKWVARKPKPAVATYFSDYIEDAWWLPILRRSSSLLDAYIDVCDLRMRRRQAEWPRLPEARFVMRNAPPLRKISEVKPHCGARRVVFTGRYYGDADRTDLLLRFVEALCENGISFTWFMPEEQKYRATIEESLRHDLFCLRPAVSKEELWRQLGLFDCGLLWRPVSETERRDGVNPNYLSVAPNKVGEYLAAGLFVLHTGSPGLDFLPPDCAVAVDPFKPEAAAEGLAHFLKDRSMVESFRGSAFRLHERSLNAEMQCAQFVDWLERRVCASG